MPKVIAVTHPNGIGGKPIYIPEEDAWTAVPDPVTGRMIFRVYNVFSSGNWHPVESQTRSYDPGTEFKEM